MEPNPTQTGCPRIRDWIDLGPRGGKLNITIVKIESSNKSILNDILLYSYID